MLPLLSPLPNSDDSRPPTRPLGFRPVEGLTAAWRASGSGLSPAVEERPTVAQLAGKRYEKHVHKHMRSLSTRFELGPWFFYRDENGLRRCQPDALYESTSVALVFEVKLHHTIDAWWQLKHRYVPVVARALNKPVRSILVVSQYDPAILWPEKLVKLNSLEFDELNRLWSDEGSMGVFEWKP